MYSTYNNWLITKILTNEYFRPQRKTQKLHGVQKLLWEINRELLLLFWKVPGSFWKGRCHSPRTNKSRNDYFVLETIRWANSFRLSLYYNKVAKTGSEKFKYIERPKRFFPNIGFELFSKPSKMASGVFIRNRSKSSCWINENYGR